MLYNGGGTQNAWDKLLTFWCMYVVRFTQASGRLMALMRDDVNLFLIPLLATNRLKIQNKLNV